MTVVLPTAEVVHLGSPAVDAPGYDLTGLFVGSEGTLALVTEITVKLTRNPEAVKTLLAVYDKVDDATETVAEITRRGITPAACEMFDSWTIRAVEEYVHAGYPIGAAAVLLIDVDGLREAVESAAEEVADICRLHHATEVRVARDAAERDLLWKGRKNAFGAVGRISPTYYAMDGVIPRTKLPETLRRLAKIGEKYRFQIGNIFHAGDGNLHPLIPFNGRDRDEFRRAIAAGTEIIRCCIDMGGSITGEHGVGMEKDHLMPFLFSRSRSRADDSRARRLQSRGLLNPGKIFPSAKACGEIYTRPAARHDERPARMSIASITASSRLASIVGPAHVASDSPELAAYEIGGKKPSSVVRPGSAEEVVEIVKFAAAEKLCIVAAARAPSSPWACRRGNTISRSILRAWIASPPTIPATSRSPSSPECRCEKSKQCSPSTSSGCRWRFPT